MRPHAKTNDRRDLSRTFEAPIRLRDRQYNDKDNRLVSLITEAGFPSVRPSVYGTSSKTDKDKWLSRHGSYSCPHCLWNEQYDPDKDI